MFKKVISFLYTNSPNIIIVIITLLYIALSLLRHFHFRTYGYDLGIYDQTVWLYSRFLYPFVTVEYKFALLNHFSPSLALFAPLYWIWSDPKVLLILQAIMMGASALPLDWLAKKLNLPIYLRAILTLSYLTFYGYQFSINFDVHSIVFGTVLVPWLIWKIENKEYKWAAVLMAITLGMKESFPVITFSIGLIYFLRGRRKVGSIIAVSSLLYMFTVLKILFPIMENLTDEHYRFVASNPVSLQETIGYLVNTPQKQEVWRLSYLWFALIPLFSPITLIASLADLTFYFVLGNNHPETGNIFLQYRSSIAPLLAWATIYGVYNLHNLDKFRIPIRKIKLPSIPYFPLAILLTMSWAFFQYTYHLPLNTLSKKTWYTWPQYIADNNAVLKQVPPDVGIAAQDNLIPHIDERKDLHVLWSYKRNDGYREFTKETSPCGEEKCFWLSYHKNVKFLVTDTHEGQGPKTLLMENEKKLDEGLANMEKAGFISLVTKQGKAAIWKVNKYYEDML